jgi:hypothetical protein
MPGGAHDVEAQELPPVEGVVHNGIGGFLNAQAERPLSIGIILRLDGAEVSDHSRGRGQWIAGQVLVD